MSWLDWLIGAAVTVAAAWLIAETVSFFITKRSLRQLLLEKKERGTFGSGCDFSAAAAAMISSNTGHEITFDMFDEYSRSLGRGRIVSDAGISQDIQVGDVIYLSDPGISKDMQVGDMIYL